MSSLAVTGAFLQARMSTQAQSSNDSSYPIPPNLASRRQYIHPRVPSANPSIPTDDLSKSRILSTSPANESYTSYPTPPIPRTTNPISSPTPPIPPRPSPTKSDVIPGSLRPLILGTLEIRTDGPRLKPSSTAGYRLQLQDTVFNCRIPSSTAGYRLQLQDTVFNCRIPSSTAGYLSLTASAHRYFGRGEGSGLRPQVKN
jgi:hypothetical protein